MSNLHRYRNETSRDALPGKIVRLAGWVHRVRDHGGLLFLDLRDCDGLIQCVVDPESAAFEVAEMLRSEWVVRIDGRVRARPEGTENLEITTGRIEVTVEDIEVLARAEELPLPIASEQPYPEDIRLRYRFLDLRRKNLRDNIVLRSEVIRYLREQMDKLDFMEIQTPILTASSPEGARDFLVPSRLHPGKFYALPQAPQQFKQLLMVGGFDRYYQIAPCFRDEDARADRSPGEFYQLDIEMAFVEQEDVFGVIEPVLANTFSYFGFKPVETKFPRIAYEDAMSRYGTDKPDLRNPIVIYDLTDLFDRDDVTLNVFKSVIARGGVVRAIPALGATTQPRAYFDKMNEWARSEGAGGLAYIQFDELLIAKGPIAKHLSPIVLEEIISRLRLRPNDAVFFSCDMPEKAAKLAGAARAKIGLDLGLTKLDQTSFCWIVDFPMYEWNPIEKRIDFSHNPFSMPQMDTGEFLALDPIRDRERILGLKAYQYDIVCNGVELSSGAIRNHRRDVMRKAFELAGHDEAVLEERFGGLYRAFRYGAPPHGGIAPGIDRIVMLLAGEDNLREVVAFPMNQRAEDLLMGAPSVVSDAQMRDLHIRPIPTAKA